jgi:hypothetical protein
MRNLGAAGAAVSLCLALGGVPALGQSPSAAPTASGSAPMPAAVSGTLSLYYMSFLAATTLRSADPADTLHPRDATFGPQGVSATTTDPRVSGARTYHWNQDRWGAVADGPLALIQWGTARIENAGGAWEGKGSGVYSTDRGDIIAVWYKGSGGYAGLGYFELLTGHQQLTIRGLIFAGDPPDLSGIAPVTGPAPSPNVPPAPTTIPMPTPTAIAYGPVSVTTGTSEYTVVDLESNTFAGIVTSDDPRSSGEYLAPGWTLDFVQLPGYDYGMGPQWGPSRLANAGGTWQGACSGVYDGSDAFACWYRGTGGYAGLGYFELIVRSDWFGPTGGAVTTGNFGLIFPGDPPTP